jgi:cell division GTPase FtsZ
VNYEEYLKGGGKMPEAEETPLDNQIPEKEADKIDQADGSIEDLGLELPDIPLPMTEPERAVIEDAFKGKSAFRLAIVGVGQGGSRIAEAFWNLGYRRVCILNTAKQDLASVDVPEDNKLLVGDSGGAGKDPDKARAVFERNYEDILDFLRRSFEGGFDRVIVCAGAGGGTGAGGVEVIVNVCHDLCQSLGVERGSSFSSQVGAIVALPTRAEGQKVQSNAESTCSSLIKMSKENKLSPMVLLDNEKIKQIYPGLSISKFWKTANNSIVSLLHVFNRISAQDSEFTSFDRADLDTVFASGIITFGATPIDPDKINETAISHAIRDNLRNSILAGVDLSTGNIAAAVLIGHKDYLDEIPQESIEHGFEQLTRQLGEGSTVHRGIYPSNQKTLAVYTVIGGLQPPEELFSYFFKTDRRYK